MYNNSLKIILYKAFNTYTYDEKIKCIQKYNIGI